MQLLAEGHDAPVDLRANHAVADGGVDAVSKVDGRRPGGQGAHIPAGGEYEHLVGKHIDLQPGEKVLRVALLLGFQQAADPREFLLIPVPDAGGTGFVFPVGGDAVFRGAVHLPGADLHLEGDGLAADDRGMEGLVTVGLGRGDIILELARYGLEHIVDLSQHVVAVGQIVHDHPQGADIENLIELQLLGVHFAVNAVQVLDPVVGGAVNAPLVQTGADLLLHARHEGLQLGTPGLDIVRDGLIGHGVEIFERQILQLPFDRLDAEAVGDGGVDLHGLEGLQALLLRRLVVHRQHIVQPVRQLDEDYADVAAHGHEHLPHILHLLFFAAGVVDPRQLGDAFDDVGDHGAELPDDLLMGDGRILNGVVQQSGNDGILVKTHRNDNTGRRRNVGDIGGTVLTFLLRVGVGGEFKRFADALPVDIQAGVADALLQFGIALFNSGFKGFRHAVTSLRCIAAAVAGSRTIPAPFSARRERRRSAIRHAPNAAPTVRAPQIFSK